MKQRVANFFGKMKSHIERHCIALYFANVPPAHEDMNRYIARARLVISDNGYLFDNVKVSIFARYF